ncbi:MAG: hypothetical protein IKL62_05460 [Clostridia bacterium]|nr:hypothetical protein [Clostridia bacterium]
MKAVILSLIILLLLCGCSSQPADSSSAGDYVTTVLGYKDASSFEFTLGSETKALSVGDSLGGYKLEALKSRTTDDRFVNIRADFSCEILLSGTVRYQKSTTYKNTLQFYPDDPSLLPKAKGDREPLVWVIIRGEGDPMTTLGIEPGVAAEKKVTVTMTVFSTNYMQHNTINYITIKTGE